MANFQRVCIILTGFMTILLKPVFFLDTLYNLKSYTKHPEILFILTFPPKKVCLCIIMVNVLCDKRKKGCVHIISIPKANRGVNLIA